MKFNCICPDTETIEIVQSKTKQALTLPLLEDVKAAINDYVENARPPSVDEHIFLKMRGYGSILPQTITSNIRRIFEKSGINLSGRRHGSHALRSSLASALLAEGNDFSAIQKVLGQRDIQSTRSYVRADIEKLRTNALPIPVPSENYERLLAEAGAAV
jgi:site-specific recombinase XerD